MSECARKNTSVCVTYGDGVEKWSRKREFGPEIWSPEVTKSAAVVAADKISVPQSRHVAWPVKFCRKCSQFCVSVLFCGKLFDSHFEELIISENLGHRKSSIIYSLEGGFNCKMEGTEKLSTQSATFFMYLKVSLGKQRFLTSLEVSKRKHRSRQE